MFICYKTIFLMEVFKGACNNTSKVLVLPLLFFSLYSFPNLVNAFTLSSNLGGREINGENKNKV